MPFYRYECGECGEQFRVLQRNGEEGAVECPRCGGRRVAKRLPRIGVIYRGSGYYSTDYRRKVGAKGGAPEAGTKPTKQATEATDD